MNIKIRHETQADHRKIEEITRDAFWNLYIPGCEEHYLVHRIRKHPDFIPELSFVIESDGELAGSIFYTRSKVVSNDGAELQTLTFGPVSIAPNLHRKGLGRALITHSIETAKQQGERAIIIAGYPYHYETYGFVGAKKYGISMPDGKFYKGIQALPLRAGALDGVSRKIYFSDVCNPPTPSELEEFDKTFPPRKKCVQQSQKEFELASQALDMKILEIDARGKDCPQPVIMTKNAVSGGADELLVIVDNAIAAANVGRFLAKNGFSSKEERSQSGDIFIKGSRESVTLPTSEQKQSGGSHSGGYVVLFTRSVIGGEDKELGEVLAKAYLGALSQVRVPESIILMNEGAKLAIPGSSSCEHLKVLGELGTDILVCGTCVKHFGIDVGVGTISNMLDIAEVIASAEHVVSF